MRIILALIAAFMLTLSPCEDSVISVDGHTLMLSFEDDFNGSELDPTRWERCPEYHRQDLNNYWDDSMSYLDSEGNLILEMSYDAEGDRYLSGAVRTRGIFEQAYGYFEIRCKVNTVENYWTAFWLMGDSVNSEENGGVDGTEIDIMETPHPENKVVNHTLNWDGYADAHKALGKQVVYDVYDGEYHTFSLLWTQSEYVFYIDATETWRTNAAEAEGICEVPLYAKISCEMGSWAGKPDPNALPAYMTVDYVRIYALCE